MIFLEWIYWKMIKINIFKKIQLRELVKKLVYQKMQFPCSIVFFLIGFAYYRFINKKYGYDTIIIFLRGATGDTFLVGRWMKAYITEKKIKKYIFIGDAGGLKSIFDLYGYENTIQISHFLAVCFQQFSLICNNNKIHSMFLWPHTRYFNRCRFRMIEPFTFFDTYMYYVFNFKSIPRYTEINFNKTNKYYNIKISPQNTIIISPYANSVKIYSDRFWIRLIDKLRKIGFQVIVNCGKQEKSFGCERIFFYYKDAKSILEYAGYFIGLRSGLCDIVSSIDCIKVVLYPRLLPKPNYSEHRSDMQFCSLKTLGLCKDVIELDSVLINNITDKKIDLTEEMIGKEETLLINKIIMNINKLGGKNES